MDAESGVMEVINAVPEVKCGACGHPKHPCLFTPGQLKRKTPECRMCRQKKAARPK